MKTLESRLLKLEQKHDSVRIKKLDIVIVSCKDHVQNQDKYNRVLQSEETSESGFTRRIFHLEPKVL
ncbi:hypothetical protein DYD21_10085 [Rhodohalobacter sp. SW132]|nr:hypothetical protein DYD21_10085 [Rhodohalobacter sp. SW132]